MAIPYYGQNKLGDDLSWAKNSVSGDAYGTVAVAGANTQYGAAASPMAKTQLNRTIVNGHADGLDVFLPAVSSADAGMWLRVVVGVTNTTAIIVTAATGDPLVGNVIITKASDAVANAAYFASDGSDLIFTMNGGTTGGLIGSEVLFQVNKDGYWMVSGNLNGSGTLATSFS
tara:strand:- start:12313 stop:12828 length:516 start_codon:yes stop_codon:yes gene_type:complete